MGRTLPQCAYNSRSNHNADALPGTTSLQICPSLPPPPSTRAHMNLSAPKPLLTFSRWSSSNRQHNPKTTIQEPLFQSTLNFPQRLTPSTQEVTTDRYVDIPEAVQEIYRIWRPSPLFRAHNLEKALGTTCRIYYKYAGAPGVRVPMNKRFFSGTRAAAQRAPTSRTPLCRR